MTLKRVSVSLTSDVVDALDRVVKSGEFENNSHAPRRAVSIAFVEQRRTD